MASADQMRKLGIAENGSNYPSKWNRMGGWHNRMFGSYQVSQDAWKDAGGDPSHWGANHAGTASFDEQTQVAGKYFDMCGDDYPNYNLGKGNADKLRNAGSQPFSVIDKKTHDLINGQAWCHVPPETPCNVVLQRCYDYYNNGKSDGKNFSGQGEAGTSQPYSTAGTNSDNLANGMAGGVIILWLEKNTTDPTQMIWHTDKKTHTIDGRTVENIHEMFYVPDNIAYMSSDTFAGIKEQSGTASGKMIGTINPTGTNQLLSGGTLNYETLDGNPSASDNTMNWLYDDNNKKWIHLTRGGLHLQNGQIRIKGECNSPNNPVGGNLCSTGGTIQFNTATAQTSGFTATMQLQTDTRTGLPMVCSSTNMYMFKPVIFGGKSS